MARQRQQHGNMKWKKKKKKPNTEKVECRQKAHCTVWLVNICEVVMGPVPGSGSCLNNLYLNMGG